jgi:hypothetical protein
VSNTAAWDTAALKCEVRPFMGRNSSSNVSSYVTFCVVVNGYTLLQPISTKFRHLSHISERQIKFLSRRRGSSSRVATSISDPQRFVYPVAPHLVTVGDSIMHIDRNQPPLDHFGIVKALLDSDLLPRVVAGTSAGGLVASLVCTRTDDELRRILIPQLSEKISACSESFHVWFERFRRTGARFDTLDWARKVCAPRLPFAYSIVDQRRRATLLAAL